MFCFDARHKYLGHTAAPLVELRKLHNVVNGSSAIVGEGLHDDKRWVERTDTPMMTLNLVVDQGGAKGGGNQDHQGE